MIKVCVACYRGMHKNLVLALEQLQHSIDYELQIGSGRYPNEVRNALIDNSDSVHIHRELDKKYSHYFLVDHALEFNPDYVHEMIEADVDIIGMTVPHPQQKDCFTAGMWAPDNVGILGSWLPTAVPAGIHSVGWVADHGLLVKREALEKMSYPWFHPEIMYAAEEVEDKLVRSVVVSSPDVGFCMRAAAAELDVHAYVGKGISIKYHWPPQDISPISKGLRLNFKRDDEDFQKTTGLTCTGPVHL